MSGPAPTPTAILAQRGSWRAKIRNTEPIAALSCPKAPKGLNSRQRSLWKSYGEKLMALGVLTDNDSTALILLVNAHHDYELLHEHCLKTGIMVTGKDGHSVKNPAIAMKSDAWKNLLKICQEFGLSPSSRTRVNAIPADDDSEKDNRYDI